MSTINEQLKQYLTYLYSFTFLPIYYYLDGGLAFCQPSSAISYLPPAEYLNAFRTIDHKISYQQTNFGGLYGYVKDVERNGFFIIGPISSVRYDSHTMFSMQREFHVPQNEQKAFQEFLSQIPKKNLSEFQALLSFISYSVNLEIYSIHDLNHPTSAVSQKMLDEYYVALQYQDKESDFENNSLDIENILLTNVEAGNEEGIQEFLNSSYQVYSGTIATSGLRNLKNTMIVSTALVCRAAIRGGLTPELAFHLSDSYILLMEAQNSLEVIQDLGRKMVIDYTHRVHEAQASRNGDPLLKKAIKFIHHNTNQPIDVSDVADYVGLSRGYLSKLFKQELGFDISAFIRRCKLEEAKELLRYSDRSISEISSYLCFSSQSHFQNVFKKQYEITPLQYRRGVDE